MVRIQDFHSCHADSNSAPATECQRTGILVVTEVSQSATGQCAVGVERNQ